MAGGRRARLGAMADEVGFHTARSQELRDRLVTLAAASARASERLARTLDDAPTSASAPPTGRTRVRNLPDAQVVDVLVPAVRPAVQPQPDGDGRAPSPSRRAQIFVAVLAASAFVLAVVSVAYSATTAAPARQRHSFALTEPLQLNGTLVTNSAASFGGPVDAPELWVGSDGLWASGGASVGADASVVGDLRVGGTAHVEEDMRINGASVASALKRVDELAARVRDLELELAAANAGL